jgi:hypothetical protein
MKLLVVGCQKSGTTAISSLLSLGSGWSLLNDPPESWSLYPPIYQGRAGLGLPLWWKLRRHDIVKQPGFSTILSYLRGRVGEFSTLYCVRDPRDAAAAVLERLDHANAERVAAYLDVEWLGGQASTPAEGVAWRWRRYLEIADEYEKAGNRITYLSYEAFCERKTEALDECARELEMPLDPDKVRPEIDRPFNKRWNNRIAGPGRWKTDLKAEDAAAIVRICGEQMARWGYLALLFAASANWWDDLLGLVS